MTQYPSFDTPPMLPEEPAGEAPGWPKTFGIISIILGALGILANICGGCFAIFGGPFIVNMFKNMPKPTGGQHNIDPDKAADAMAAMQPWMMVQGLGAVVNLGVSVWLLVAGISLVRRRRSGVGMHKAWACVRLVMVVGTSALAVVAGMATAEMQATMQTAMGSPTTVDSQVLKAVLQGVVFFVWGVIYPVVVLIYMSKPKVKEHLEVWFT